MISAVRWSDMGHFTCVAESPLGRDSVTTFLYPMSQDRKYAFQHLQTFIHFETLKFKLNYGTELSNKVFAMCKPKNIKDPGLLSGYSACLLTKKLLVIF